MRTALVEVTAFNSIIPIPAFTLPASEQTSEVSETSEVSPAPEANFGGTVNVIPAEQSSTTTTNGESVFQGVSVQTGFSAGDQSASLPIANPSILWGAAAAALLGSTLAEWQKKREEEAARLAALKNSGGGGGEEEPSKRKNPGRVKYEEKMRQKRIVGISQALLNEKAAERANAARVHQQAQDARAERKGALLEEQMKSLSAKPQDWRPAYNAYMARKAADIHREGERAGQEEERQYDLTGWMPLVMNRNIESPELADMKIYNDQRQLKPYELIIPGIQMPINSAFSALWVRELAGDFRTLNTGGGRWDIKLEMKEEFRNGTDDEDSAHILCSNSGTCRWVDYSTAGNVLYGVTAADAGVPRWMSKVAGGLLELRDGTFKGENWWNMFEDPYDTNAVNFGYDLYESTGGNITEEAFRNALTDEVLNSFQPPPEGFVPPFEAQPQSNTYPADRFDQP
ncbi:MAG: polymorphic toxin type 44 domain-containing protein [Anaerolineales bacterium]|nr:polymorphic toxin type 44 domain-containing protein [Anaerolineales bacterium]